MVEIIEQSSKMENQDLSGGETKSDQQQYDSPVHSGALHKVYISLIILILFINYFLSQYDKFILSYFQAEVIESLSLSSTQYALLSGYSTGIVYALLALPVAFIADYTRARVWTLSIAAAWWSLSVIFQSLAKNFAQIYLARLAMGIGQAAVEALSVSLITDLVKWRNSFVGSSVLYVGVYVGEAVSGQIATVFRATGTGWQVALRAIGITGLVVAVLLRVMILREPERRKSLVQEDASSEEGSVGRQQGSALSDLKNTVVYLARMRSFTLLVMSAGMRQLAGNVFGYYMPGYLSSLYPTRANLLSRYGIVVGTVGTASVLSGGIITSLLWHKTKLTPVYLTAVGGMISSIFVLLMIFSKDIAHGNEEKGIAILYGVMSAAYLTAELWLGCMFALVALLLPPAYKTFGFAIWSSVQVLVYSSGPEIIGLALRKTDPNSPEYVQVSKIALAVIIPVGYWACGIGLLSAVPLFKRDLQQDFVRSDRLSPQRRLGFWAVGAILTSLVVVLFTTSLIYEA
jgi:MFS family permease